MRKLRLFPLVAILLISCNLLSAASSPPVQNAESAASDAQTTSRGYISFIINTHDWVHSDESADTLIRLIDLFERYGVRGDFYLTAPVVKAYMEARPDVIERLKNSEMTISYHVRAPHPLYSGFDSRLKGLSDEELYQMLLDYETYALDLATGDLDRSQPGGYAYVAEVFGRAPVVAPTPNSNPRVKSVARQVYADLGAQMTLLYHEGGTDMQNPLIYVDDLLVRPSDFGVTRVTSVNGSQNFWWNLMLHPEAEMFAPVMMLQNQLDEWEAQNDDRLPFVTALIHENNFYRSGSAAWGSYYYGIQNGNKTTPLVPPFDLSALDPSTARSL
ncbi:MAG: hypothetical protein AB1649_26585, partial [Chloroflexota bacterium]